ncbi:Copper transport protein 86 [Yarrowia sp. C11]|nr:Copper transport protein 86 [Yarrowia sp. E02]KAG5369411.1 Copper transport protein 86 [Yarrowia sp. C11]
MKEHLQNTLGALKEQGEDENLHADLQRLCAESARQEISSEAICSPDTWLLINQCLEQVTTLQKDGKYFHSRNARAVVLLSRNILASGLSQAQITAYESGWANNLFRLIESYENEPKGANVLPLAYQALCNLCSGNQGVSSELFKAHFVFQSEKTDTLDWIKTLLDTSLYAFVVTLCESINDDVALLKQFDVSEAPASKLLDVLIGPISFDNALHASAEYQALVDVFRCLCSNRVTNRLSPDYENDVIVAIVKDAISVDLEEVLETEAKSTPLDLEYLFIAYFSISMKELKLVLDSESKSCTVAQVIRFSFEALTVLLATEPKLPTCSGQLQHDYPEFITQVTKYLVFAQKEYPAKRKLKDIQTAVLEVTDYPHVKSATIELLSSVLQIASATSKTQLTLVQELIWKAGGLPEILNSCNIDANNPFLKERGVVCLRYVMEGNEEAQKFVADLEAQSQAQKLDPKNEQSLP